MDERLKVPMSLILAVSTASFNIGHFVLDLISTCRQASYPLSWQLVQHDFKASINKFSGTFFSYSTNGIIKFSPLAQSKNPLLVRPNLW